jgi:hypothetical protein
MSGFLIQEAIKTVEPSLLSPVALLSDLNSIDTLDLNSGISIYVNQFNDFYVLKKNTNYVIDGLCVVAATDGYWVSKQVGRWDDIQGPIEQGTGSASLTKGVWRDTPFPMYWMRHDQNDELSFTYQLSHQWKHDSNVIPHIHVMIGADPPETQFVYVEGYYAWSRPNNINQLPELSGWTYFDEKFAINPGDINTQKIFTLANIKPPEWARASTSVLVFFKRSGTNILDTYKASKSYGLGAANLAILTTDLHYQKLNLGTEGELPRDVDY